MAKDESKSLVWRRNRGRDGWSSVLDVASDRSVETRNLHLYNGGLGTRRGGCTSVTITGVTAPINAMVEFVPAQDETASELFVVDSSATTKILRCAGGSSFSNLTLKDNVATAPQRVSFAVLNGKLYLAYDSTVNRLHKFDPAYSTTDVIRAGMGTAAAATVADGGGAGAYPATLRYYRVAYAEYVGGVRKRLGLLGASVSFTPSGANANATITKPAAINEGETHWELYGSADNVTYYLLSVGGVGTPTIADTTLVSAYASRDAMPTEGQNTPFPSVKYLATDGTRLLGFGVWESTAGDSLAPKAGRVYFGPVLDATTSTLYAVDDDERINNTTTLSGWIDVARNSGAEDRGITSRPVNGNFFAFQSNGVYAIIPTDSPIQPYRREVIDPVVGSVSHQAIVIATDSRGETCAFFLDPVKGPYVVGGKYGLRWCGKDVADLWATVNINASTMVAWGLWYPKLQQVVFAVATGSSNDPNLLLVLDVTELYEDEDGDLRGGWTTYDDAFANSRCGVMFSTSLAATRSRVRVPYVGSAASNGLGRYDESVYSDYGAGAGFDTYVTSGALAVSARTMMLMRSYIIGEPLSGFTVSITQELIRNTGDEVPRAAAAVLTLASAPAAQEITLQKFEASALVDAWMFQVRLGSSAVAAPYILNQWRAVLTEGSDF